MQTTQDIVVRECLFLFRNLTCYLLIRLFFLRLLNSSTLLFITICLYFTTCLSILSACLLHPIHKESATGTSPILQLLSSNFYFSPYPFFPTSILFLLCDSPDLLILESIDFRIILFILLHNILISHRLSYLSYEFHKPGWYVCQMVIRK